MATNGILNLLPQVREFTASVFTDAVPAQLPAGWDRDAGIYQRRVLPRNGNTMSTTPTQGAAASSSQGIRGSQQGQEWSQRGGNQLQWIFFGAAGQEPSQKRWLGRFMTSFHGKFPPVCSI